MKVQPAYLTGTHPYSFRSGQKAKIIGVVTVPPDAKLLPRLGFAVEYPDGEVDYVAISDVDTYRLDIESELT